MFEISVIIPCLNEIQTIGKTISGVSRELIDARFSYEIIVVDNGSVDGSDVVAKNLKANVVHSKSCTIGGVRNTGVGAAKGHILVFLDADMLVGPLWGQALKCVYKRMIKNDNFITGSHPKLPYNIMPVLHSWYKGISEDLRDTHLGSGHMVVSKKLFKKVGGFAEHLVSGEDYDFCNRAKKSGYAVISNPNMMVIHLGYPNSLFEFAKREIWHGEGDCINLNSFINSRVALSGTTLILLNLATLLCLFIYTPLFFFLLAINIIFVFSITIYKFGYGNLRDFIYRNIISFIYLSSRGISLAKFLLITKKSIK